MDSFFDTVHFFCDLKEQRELEFKAHSLARSQLSTVLKSKKRTEMEAWMALNKDMKIDGGLPAGWDVFPVEKRQFIEGKVFVAYDKNTTRMPYMSSFRGLPPQQSKPNLSCRSSTPTSARSLK